MHNSQQPGRSHTTSSHAMSDLTSDDDRPRSPVSPIDSNGETWKYPRSAKAHLEGLGTLHKGPQNEAPKDHFRSRPISYYDGLQTSPEPSGKEVFTNIPSAPAKKRNPSAPAAAVPMQANLTRADSHLRRQPAEVPHPRAAPAPPAVPKPAHQSRRKRAPTPIAIPISAHQFRRPHEPNPRRENQRSAPHQGNQPSTQRPARHQGWNPLEEPSRQQRSTHAHHQGRRRGDDLERQADLTRTRNRAKDYDPQYKSGRRCFFSLMIMMILAIVVIVVVVEKNLHQK